MNPDQRPYVRLALCRCDEVCAKHASLSASDWLSPAEHERWTAMRSPVRRQQFLAGRWLLREMLAHDQGDGPPEAWQLSAGVEGAPTVIERPTPHEQPVFLGLSHSATHVAAAVATCRVGLDIEVLRPRRDLDGLASLALDPGEYATWRAEPLAHRLASFYALWTVKEAWIKQRNEPLTPGRLARMRTRAARISDPLVALGFHDDALAMALACPPSSTITWWPHDGGPLLSARSALTIDEAHAEPIPATAPAEHKT